MSENEDDFELSHSQNQSFVDAETHSQESQDNFNNLPLPPPLSRENLRDTLIHLLTNDNNFVDQIHSAYLSNSTKF